MTLIRIFENDDWIVDYDKECDMYRVSYFEDGHFKDECFFESFPDIKSQEICKKSEDIDSLIPYINKPVYIKGHCWNKNFDGWAIIYDAGKTWIFDTDLRFDYKGQTYSVRGFLPNEHTSSQDSRYNNMIIYSNKICCDGG